MKQKTARKILYLDYDGVLHDEDVWWHKKHGIYLTTPNRRLFEWSHILERIVAEHTDLRIVLSTSWVAKRSFRYAVKKLSASMRERVIGATFHHREMALAEFMSKPRGIQIAGDVARRGPANWIALDDDNEGWPERYLQNLIHTDGSLGLNDTNVENQLRAKLNQMGD